MKYVYKTVAAILALAVIAVAICTPIIAVSMESLVPAALVLIGSYLKNDKATELLEEYEGSIPSAIGERISVLDLIAPTENSIASIIKNFGSEEATTTVIDALEPVIPSIICFIVTFALIIICALVTAITAFACKNNRIPIYFSIIGCGLNVMLFKTFGDVAGPFLNGEITLSSLVGSDWMMLLGEITGLEVPSTMWFITVLFVCVIVWTILYNATLPAEEKIKRKRMLGEVDE